MSAFGHAGFGSANRIRQLRNQGMLDQYGQQQGNQRQQAPNLSIYATPSAYQQASGQQPQMDLGGSPYGQPQAPANSSPPQQETGNVTKPGTYSPGQQPPVRPTNQRPGQQPRPDADDSQPREWDPNGGLGGGGWTSAPAAQEPAGSQETDWIANTARDMFKRGASPDMVANVLRYNSWSGPLTGNEALAKQYAEQAYKSYQAGTGVPPGFSPGTAQPIPEQSQGTPYGQDQYVPEAPESLPYYVGSQPTYITQRPDGQWVDEQGVMRNPPPAKASQPQQAGPAPPTPGMAQPIPPPSQGTPYGQQQTQGSSAEMLSYDSLREQLSRAWAENELAKRPFLHGQQGSLDSDYVKRHVDTMMALHDRTTKQNIEQYRDRPGAASTYQQQLQEMQRGIQEINADTESRRQSYENRANNPTQWVQDDISRYLRLAGVNGADDPRYGDAYGKAILAGVFNRADTRDNNLMDAYRQLYEQEISGGNQYLINRLGSAQGALPGGDPARWLNIQYANAGGAAGHARRLQEVQDMIATGGGGYGLQQAAQQHLDSFLQGPSRDALGRPIQNASLGPFLTDDWVSQFQKKYIDHPLWGR